VRGQRAQAASGRHFITKQSGSNYKAERGQILFARLHLKGQGPLGKTREIRLDMLSASLSITVIVRRLAGQHN